LIGNLSERILRRGDFAFKCQTIDSKLEDNRNKRIESENN
jgi:hypothetical protein